LIRWRADLALLATAALWGVAFVAQKHVTAVLPPISFVAARFAISALALAPFAYFETRWASAPLDGRSWRMAIFIALTLFTGSVLQQVGLTTTSAGHAGFLTACYVVLVPVAVWLLTGLTPRQVIALACALSLGGAWLLAHDGGPSAPMTLGDGLILLSDVAWSLGIAATPMFLLRAHRPFTLAFMQYVVCASLSGLAAPAFESAHLQDFAAGWLPLLYAGLVSGGVAFTMQIIAQRYAPAAEAALILSLESVFAALAGSALLGERLTGIAMAGCALILTSVLVVEIGPPMLLRLRRARA